MEGRAGEGAGLSLLAQVAAPDPDDGLRIALDSERGAEIPEGDAYAGVRVSMVANLAGARLGFHIDEGSSCFH